MNNNEDAEIGFKVPLVVPGKKHQDRRYTATFDDEAVIDEIYAPVGNMTTREKMKFFEKVEDGVTGFERFREGMVSIHPNGKILKKIMKEGSGDLIPESGFVSVNYSIWVEKEKGFPLMVESSKRTNKNKPVEYELGIGMYPGFYLALCSMKLGEIATFLVHYSLAYGELGILERYPPRSTILMEIEMVNYIEESKKVVEVKEKPECFQGHMECVRKMIECGENAKKSSEALYFYGEALRYLSEDIIVANEYEEAKLNEEFSRIYRNMAPVHVSKREYDLAIRCYQQCRKINEKVALLDVKFVLAVSEAMLKATDGRKDAKALLMGAAKLRPNDIQLHERYYDICEMEKKDLEEEKKLYSKMFSFGLSSSKPTAKKVELKKASPVKTKETENKNEEEFLELDDDLKCFAADFEVFLGEFMKSHENQCNCPIFPREEMQIVTRQCKNLGIVFEHRQNKIVFTKKYFPGSVRS